MVTRHNNPALTPEEAALYGPEAQHAAESAQHDHDGCQCAEVYRRMLAYLDRRDTPSPNALYEFPADTTTYDQLMNAGFPVRCMSVMNLTTSAFTIAFDDGSVLPIQAGAVMSFIPPNTQNIKVTSGQAVSGTLRLTAYANAPDIVIGGAIFSVGGGSGGSVTIVGPLDGSGNVETVLREALPAGTNLIGHVDVDNFPATQNVAVTGALPAGGNVIGQVVAQGNIGDVQQDAAGNVYVEERAAVNGATSQITASTTAATAAIARSTRQRVEFRNLDATISVWIGPATVTSGNGALLKAGESRAFYGQGLWQVIAASGTPAVEVVDYWN